jgi:hypothetical protein
MQQPAFADPGFGGDGIQGQVRDTLAPDHFLGCIQQSVRQFAVRPFHGRINTVRTVGCQPSRRFVLDCLGFHQKRNLVAAELGLCHFSDATNDEIDLGHFPSSLKMDLQAAVSRWVFRSIFVTDVGLTESPVRRNHPCTMFSKPMCEVERGLKPLWAVIWLAKRVASRGRFSRTI